MTEWLKIKIYDVKGGDAEVDSMPTHQLGVL